MGIDQDSKTYRALELCLVIGVAFAAPILIAIYGLFVDSPMKYNRVSGVLVFYGLIYESLALAVTVYVLSRQRRSLRQIGFSFAWKDIPVSLLLIVVSYIAFYFCYLAIFYAYYFVAGQALAPAGRKNQRPKTQEEPIAAPGNTPL